MSPTPPRVSIVITCYNYAQYVGTAIDSALAQSHPGVEVIVVNDGSTDGSADVIRRYEGRVRSIWQSNQGSIAAYNRGYAESTGDLVWFLDADDVAEHDAVEAVVAAWRPGCVKLQYDLKIIDAAGDDLGRRFCNFVPGYDAAHVRDTFARTGTYLWPVTAGNVYARTYLEQLTPLKVGIGPDGLLNTVAPVYGDVLTIPRCLASYRLHGSNMWATNGLDLTRLPERILSRRLEIAELVAHAQLRGVALPPGNILDHELAFINYRLMAMRLGQRYEGMQGETATALWWRGMQFLASELMPWPSKLMHTVWLGAIWLSPRPLASALIQLRFQRARYTQPIRRKLASWFGRRGDVAASSGSE